MGIKKDLRKVRRGIEGMFFEPMRPTGMIIGTQKGGTTALSHYLAQHPDVVPARKKEIHFFNHNDRFRRGLEFYHGHYERRTPARRARMSLDITPAYLAASSIVARRIRAYDPGLKLVAVLRDPVRRAYSAWQMYRRYYEKNPSWFDGWVDTCVLDGYPRGCRKRMNFGDSFLEDVQEEIEALAAGELVEMSVIYQGFYARHLRHFLQHFPAEQLLVLGSEAMKADTRAHLRQLESHFGLSHHDWCDEQLEPHFEGGYQESIPDEAHELLADYYRPHNRALFELLGQEFDWS